MKIGLIYTAYNTAEYVEESLAPWIALKKELNIAICAVCVPFAGFEHDAVDDTEDKLRAHDAAGNIDYLITEPVNIPETAARGMALQWLTEQGVDILWQLDADEICDAEGIRRAVKYLEENPLSVWFKVAYRNAVFTKNQFLAEPFTPARIHRVNHRGLVADFFWDDNNIAYRGRYELKKDIELACQTIPVGVFNPIHYTWLSDLRAKKKVEYQRRRWGHCSFRWGANGLEFDPDYYKGKPFPEMISS